jgi:threonine dehydratase
VTFRPTLADVEAARDRIRSRVRRTPVLGTAPLREPASPATLWLKLENLQITGSFKARGATNKLATLGPDAVGRGLITASGGNHGLGVAYAGWLAGVPATIYLPCTTPEAKAHALEAWGARVIVGGAVWDDANRAALAMADEAGLTYVHPFADPAVIAGQGTVALEILDDVPDVDTVVVAIGGGGLISGVGVAIRGRRPATRVIGVEPVGAPTLHESLQAGRLVELDAIRTAATTLAPRKSEPLNLALVRETVEAVVLVDDDEMRAAARWLWRELGVGAELSSAAAVAALRAGRVPLRAGEQVCAVVCSAGSDGLD